MSEMQRQVMLAKFYRKLKILVVDDFENFRMSMRQMIRTFGVERIEVAGNGEDAVARCEREEFDIVICDYNLGAGKSGQQVLEELRYNKVLKHTSLFVMVTAETAKDMVLGALEYLPDNYITKPITRAVLQKRLDHLVEMREALKPINRAIDDEKLEYAIELLDQELLSDTKYVMWCLRTMASLYYRLGEHDKAKKIYEEVLTKRDIGWARLGMGKVRTALGEYDQAIADLNGLIRDNGNLIEAYDALAEAFLKKGDAQKAQKTLEAAVEVSPHAIMRQKKLAEVCTQNKDVEGAANAYKATVKLGHNSVHESPDNYLNLGRCLSDLSDGDTTEVGKKRAKEAVHAMERVSKKFKDDTRVKTNAALIESRVHQGQGDDANAKKALSKAEKMMDTEQADPQTKIEFAKTLYAMGDEAQAEQMLSELAGEHEGNAELMASIEELLDEPVSLQKRIKARKLNKKGITAFEKGELNSAIETFSQALKVTPKHPALNLNMVQVMLKQIKEQKGNPELVRKCEKCLANVAHIPSQHRQYKRYLHLKKKVEALSGQ
ncbi:MAG: response regulator [Oleiphilaceae bacterium]|nr:response regulator [Oleiphilaceae bacterium]